MNYSDMVRRSFRTLKSGAMWGFAATTAVARMAIMLTSLAIINAIGERGFASVIRGVSSSASSTVVIQIAYFCAIMLGLVLALPISLITLGGLTQLSDQVLSGRPARVADGWSVGGRRIGRVFAIQFVVSLISFVAVLVCSIPLILAVAAGVALSVRSASGGGNPVPAIVGVCFGYLIFLVFLVFATVFFAAFGALAIRYGVIGQRTAGDAIGSAFKAVRARLKNVFVYSLIQLGLGLVWAVAMAIVLIPVEIATGAGQRGPTLSHMLGAYAINGSLTSLLAIPLVVLTCSMWTAFFRQMTGLDPAQPTQPSYTPPMYAPSGAPYAANSANVGPYPLYPPYAPDPSSVQAPSGPPMAPQSPAEAPTESLVPPEASHPAPPA